ncbi:MAG: M23 family metallopeptidase [Bacteroidaceae bacterium]|nr:M23 family metallopeptidase [Bacteroidaceae bacterium]
MSKKQYYIFNNETNTYEPVKGSRRSWPLIMWVLFSSFILGALLITVVYFFFGSPHDEYLRLENEQLQAKYNILSRKVDDALVVLEDIEQRDDNLYRVVMQADPIGRKVRDAGVDNAARYAELMNMSNGRLVATVTRQVDKLSRNLYVQDHSFNELVDLAHQQEERLKHVPAIQPVREKDVKRIASMFGWRIDPISGRRTYHDGIDLSANRGVPVYASGNAVVTFTGWKQGYGRVVELDHGFGYVTLYAHLHYEIIYRGHNIDPINYFFLDLTPEEYDRMIQEVANQE